MRKIELLSPAGGVEALHAAVQNGADAVYLGEKSFSARQSAENFDNESLKEAVKYAHQRGTLVYLAMNTLVGQKELAGFEKGVAEAAECGVDALIIQDFGGAEIARRVCPELPVHASTQMSAHNEKDVEYLLKRGFSRIVLARGLTSEEISKIYKNTGASLEVFVHGALCVCVSGQCLMSSFIGGRSGNRGRCAQPCRQLYTAEGKKGYFLSPRDLCLLDEITALNEAGVESLKIEGRMKSGEYVATVTGIYRKYLDNPQKAEKNDIKELEGVFVRGDGFTKGYFSHVNTPEIMNYNISNDNISSKGDKDILKKAALTYREGVENKKIGVNCSFSVRDDQGAYLVMSDGVNTVCKHSNIVENAVNVALSGEKAAEYLGKLGSTPFKLEGLECDISPGLTMSAKEINNLRRECADEILKLRGEAVKRETYKFEYEYESPPQKKIKVAASVMTEEQLLGANKADYIYMPLSLFEKVDKMDNYVVMLPKVTYDVEKYIARLKACGAKKVLSSTYGVAKALADAGFEVWGDYGLNAYNAVSVNEYKREGISHITLSPELSGGEIKSITSKTDAECEVLAYGRMMMMTTRACIVKGVRKKCECDKPLTLYDKTGAGFLVYSDKNVHINMIYNANVTFTADKREEMLGLGVDVLRLSFTDETKETVSSVVAMYKGEADVVLPKNFTRGYFALGKKDRKGV